MGKPKIKEKNFAKILYVDKRLSVTEIMLRQDVDISERTLRKWINDENWDKLRKSFLTTRENQIVQLYDQLEWLNNQIAERDIKVASSKEADSIIKITSAIKRLEYEVSLGEIMEVGRKFVEFSKEIDLNLAQQVTRLFDQFIQSNL